MKQYIKIRYFLFFMFTFSIYKGMAQTDTIVNNPNFGFFISFTPIDTISCKCTQVMDQKVVPAYLLLIKIDSVYTIFNHKIYLEKNDIFKTQYLIIPKDIQLSRDTNYIITGNQYQKEYFIFYSKIKHSNVNFKKNKVFDGAPLGLVRKHKIGYLRYIMYKILNTPEYEQVIGKEVNKTKDPILKCIKKYEKKKKKT
jgi:hypothetical protein